MSTARASAAVRTTASARLVSLLPPLLTLALAVGYVGLDVSGSVDEPVPGVIPPILRGGLVALQAVALLARHRAPIVVFAGVVLIDLFLLATSAGELGTGALAVMVAVFVLARRGLRRVAYTTIAIGAAATVVVSLLAGGASAGLTLLDVILVAAVRVIVQYVVPAAIGEYVLGRERLADALRERAELIERERWERAERDVRAGRAALARELHDIAGHHLSGIIVSAQAASALTRVDPERARDTLQSLQDDARTALADLRRTVGLLRHDDRSGDDTTSPTPAPSIERIGALVEESRSRGLDVHLALDGPPRPLGPLAETAGYRMVQESLANAARHAPGARVDVTVRYGDDAVTLTVRNTAPAVAIASRSRSGTDAGTTRERYGLAGMEERAGLIDGTLTTGSTPDGGWSNTLVIPAAPKRSPS
jgi:signal transduction histidine kinase